MVHTNIIDRRRHENIWQLKYNLDSDFKYILVGSESKNGQGKVNGSLQTFFFSKYNKFKLPWAV